MKGRARLPRLFDRLDPETNIGDLHPLAFTITEKAAPLSYGSMTIADDERILDVGQVVEPFDSYGSLGRYQIVQITRTFKQKPVQVCTLEHAAGTLKRNIINGELKWEANTATARAIFENLLSRQSVRRWQIDRSDADALAYLESQKIAMDFSDRNLLVALTDFCDYLSRDLYLAFDFTTYPWSIIPKQVVTKNEESELRLSRNVESIQVKTDWSTVVTRLWPKGEDDITIETVNPTGKKYIDSDTVKDYGIVEAAWSETTAKNPSNLFTLAKKHLEAVKDPGVTITADAYDFYKATGELYDHFVCGERCRVCIPEDKLTLTYRINELAHKDLVNNPGKVQLIMGNVEQRRLSTERKKSGGGGGGGGGSREETIEIILHGEVDIAEGATADYYFIDIYVNDDRILEVKKATFSMETRTGLSRFDYQIGNYSPYPPGIQPMLYNKVTDILCTGAVANRQITRIYIKAWEINAVWQETFKATLKITASIKKV